MTGQIVIQSSPAVNERRQPLLPRDNSIKVGELAGSAAAECAAICCCLPGTLVGCFVLAVYKVPVSIYRRILRKRLTRRKKNKKEIGLLRGAEGGGGRSSTVHCFNDNASDITVKGFESVKVSIDGSAEVINLDREMWEQFRDSGFWRSPSQRFL